MRKILLMICIFAVTSFFAGCGESSNMKNLDMVKHFKDFLTYTSNKRKTA